MDNQVEDDAQEFVANIKKMSTRALIVIAGNCLYEVNERLSGKKVKIIENV